MKCIDTDLLVAILRGKDREAKKKMDELDLEGRQATTTINAFELFYGAHTMSKADKSPVEKTIALLGRMDIFPLDLNSSYKAGELLASLAKNGKVIDFRDALIGGISLVNNMTLVTRNKDHFSRIKDLKVEDW
jgi:tRNA(fMet)-specific endonuclease VapC